jgi:DNA repair photolyase
MNAASSLLFLPVLPALPRTAPRPSTLPTQEALERRLRQAALRGQPIVLGTAAVPYSPEASSRQLLAALARTEGLLVSITTRSPLILRDLDLLAELDRRHAVAVQMMVPALDSGLAARLEPLAASPEARLGAVRRLAEEGIETRILLSPWLPGQNDRETVLRPLFAAAREAGAGDVLLPGDRQGWKHSLEGRDRRLVTFRRLRMEHGFPKAQPGRG